MTPHIFQSLVAALIRIGLLLALAIMLMAENAQAQPTKHSHHMRHMHHARSHAPKAPSGEHRSNT